jgi:hypothetical protein
LKILIQESGTKPEGLMPQIHFAGKSTAQRVSSNQKGYNITEVDLPGTGSHSKHLETYRNWTAGAEQQYLGALQLRLPEE